LSLALFDKSNVSKQRQRLVNISRISIAWIELYIQQIVYEVKYFVWKHLIYTFFNGDKKIVFYNNSYLKNVHDIVFHSSNQ